MRQSARIVTALMMLVGAAVTPAPLAAQAEIDMQPPAASVRTYRTTGTRIAVGRDIQIARDEEVRDAVAVIGGSLRVDGRVRDGLVVVGGDVDLGPESTVEGDIVLIGGVLRRADGARVLGSLSDISVGDWPGWRLGVHVWPCVELSDVARWMGLAGAVFRVSVLALLMAVIILVARAPVARVGNAAAAAPGRAFLIGLLAEIFFVPAIVVGSAILAITIIGIPLLLLLLPLVIFASVAALLLGFTALACRVGEWIEDRLGWRIHNAIAATALGLLIIVGPSLISRVLGVAPEPLRYAAFALLVAGATVEFFVWTMGLGATLMTGFGRRSLTPPPVPLGVQS